MGYLFLNSLMNNYFRFKQFTIQQERTAMKVGTDGVLLGAWANMEKARHILDIGTGTGVIALMAAQKMEEATIDAVEINLEAYEQACENVKQSPWVERIKLHHLSIFDFNPGITYDRIICNPPFFIESTPAPDKNRTQARHCLDFSHKNLLQSVKRLLSDNGHFCTILPTNEAIQLISLARQENLYVSRLTRVLPTPVKPPKRYLMDFTSAPGTSLEQDMILELSRHQYSDEYIQLTKDFYLYL